MSVLIKGMEMPGACWECPLKVHLFQQLWCVPANKVIDRESNTERASDCPLVEITTPHGRLVDADAFKETIDYYIREANWSDAHNEALGWAKEFIDNEQAIIEAEGSGE